MGEIFYFLTFGKRRRKRVIEVSKSSIWKLSPFSDKKGRLFRLFFIHIPIEPECSEMDNLKKQKDNLDYGRPPRFLY